MTGTPFYNPGSRALQDEFGSRGLADRLEELSRTAFTESDKGFIESAIYFFLATADEHGRPDVSFKGGPEGFVRVTSPSEVAFPDYDGNGMFKSLGNISVNPEVTLLFINMHGAPRRLRVQGTAKVTHDDPLMGETVGAQLMVRVQARVIFPNCPRYIPKLALEDLSPYVPLPGAEPPEPAWKSSETFKDRVPPRRPTHR